MKSSAEIKEAIELVQKFHDEQVHRDAQMMARGVMPDMVDALLCTAQISALTWLLPEEEAKSLAPTHVSSFDETLARLRERYGR